MEDTKDNKNKFSKPVAVILITKSIRKGDRKIMSITMKTFFLV